MGPKKAAGKKDEKGPPKDGFDVLLVESNQAATVILMLESPEDEVVVKACDAITKFAAKCGANKWTLLDLNVLGYLVKLTKSENNTIRLNACLALATVIDHREAPKKLKMFEDYIPTFIEMLSPDGEVITVRCATLCLLALCSFLTSKFSIWEHNGLEPVTRCLVSPDPDTQKTALDILRLMLKNIEVLQAIRTVPDALPSIMELTKSDYPDIQTLALSVLNAISEDAANRTALRELELVSKIIDLMAKPAWSDLHLAAAAIFYNMCRDNETIQQLADGPYLKKLVALITDTPLPVEEAKPKAAAGKAPAKKAPAKKGGKSDEAIKVPSSESLTGIVVPSSPELKQRVVISLALAAQNEESRKILHEKDIEKTLLLLIAHDDITVKIAVSQAMKAMAELFISSDVIGKLNGIEPLLAMVKNMNPTVQMAALLALAMVTASNEYNCKEISRYDGTRRIVSMLGCDNELIVFNCTIILINMAATEGLLEEIVALGVVRALLDPLKNYDRAELQNKLAIAFASFVVAKEQREEFINEGGAQLLVDLLDSPSADVRRSATWAVAVMAEDEPTAAAFCNRGTLNALRHMQASEMLRNAFTDVAYGKLLSNHLPSKYAMTGVLCHSDIIRDGFYDIGFLKLGMPMLPLEECMSQPINQRRPILLINAPSPPKSPQIDEVIEASGEPANCVPASGEPAGGEPATGEPGSGEPAGYSGSEAPPAEPPANCSMEDGDKVDCYSRLKPSTFMLPIDSELMGYIEEVRDTIMPLNGCARQATELGKFVVMKMGGPIGKGSLSNFSWELHISQLKYHMKTNVIPIGCIKAGIHYHRALLFKVLGDRIGVGGSLVRGEYNRAWNELTLTDEDIDFMFYGEGDTRYPGKTFIIDLIHEPGRLMRTDSPEAAIYKKL